ncbi:hypothetical protein EV643_11872 [Kribbella sp. VKM Ac-2527]|uniref:Uncharacterized protein n=1 Tax=Kribbella caucasensis TaxID=2512215 RepID=A0A4R6K276_9ACTN|nr:hypothetical protein [Kribbella sp. VKM Ac-2527]TDO43330.1 hypothetical protein EV643_11872 [Kribbella sp. VKM Ac-2527]
MLADAIGQVTDEHRDTCDVANVISPSATVAILRVSDGLVDYLVLGDSTLVLDRTVGTPVVSDPREVRGAVAADDATVAHCTDLGGASG